MRGRNVQSALKPARTALNEAFTVFTLWLLVRELHAHSAHEAPRPHRFCAGRTGALATDTGARRRLPPAVQDSPPGQQGIAPDTGLLPLVKKLLCSHETFIKGKLADEPEDRQIIKVAGAVVWVF